MNTEQEMLSLLEELLTLTKAQSRLMESSGLEGMEENLEARGQCLQKLNKLPGRDTAAARSPEAKALVAEIRACEEENIARFKKAMKYVGEQMKKTNDGKTAVKGYDGPDPEASSSFNRVE